jgi:excisionase family DNA binding protein
MITMDELLTVDQVARICRVHPVTVRRHIASGRLRSVRAGRGVRIRRDDLEAYLEQATAAHSAHEATTDRFTKEDPLWNIVGMIDEPGEVWVSGDKRRALAEAYTSRP